MPLPLSTMMTDADKPKSCVSLKEDTLSSGTRLIQLTCAVGRGTVRIDFRLGEPLERYPMSPKIQVQTPSYTEENAYNPAESVEFHGWESFDNLLALLQQVQAMRTAAQLAKDKQT